MSFKQVNQLSHLSHTLYPQLSKCPSVVLPLNYMNGKRVDPVKPQFHHPLSVPATGQVIRNVPIASEEDVNAAVSNCRHALGRWSYMSGFHRGELLLKAADILKARIEEISQIEAFDCGKPVYEARMDTSGCIDSLRFYGGLAGTITGEYFQLPDGNSAYTRREPLGVVGAIGAWNYPLQMAVLKSAPALACGNTMIFKPSPLTPLTAVILADIYTEAGLPPGCFNVIQGGGEVGSILSKHSGIDKMTFTGSVASGVKVMKDAAETIKSVTLELGGKSPLIIFEDCDINNAVTGAMLANFLSQGQVCSNAARVFVHRSIVDNFVETFVRRTKNMSIGDPLEESTKVGATISKEQADKVLSYIHSAVKEGGTVAYGGDRVHLDSESFSAGYYLSPCIITNCRDDMMAVKEEIFGSVALILPFETEEEVLQRANDTPYGLAAGVFTRDLNRAHRVVSRLQAGVVHVNTYNAWHPGVPFGGFKLSGIGRENGGDAIHYYTQLKSVYIETNNVQSPFD